MLDRTDLWQVNFHCAGCEERTKPTLLTRVSSADLAEANIWRSACPEYTSMLALAKAACACTHIPHEVSDPDGSSHVVMIEMSVRRNVV